MTPPADRPRIAQVGPDPTGPGGMEAMLGQLLASPLSERFRFDLIVSYRTPHRLWRLLVFARALLALVLWCRRQRGPCLVHVHTAVRGSIYRKALCVLVAKAAGCRVLLQLHAGPGDIETFAAGIGPMRRRLLEKALRSADRVVSVSSAGAEQIRRDFGVAEVIVIPNAAPQPRDAREEPARGRDSTLLYMGGFDNPAKGGDVLCRAMPDVLERCPDLSAVLAGSGSLPSAASLWPDERIEWRGWLAPEPKALELARCRVFVMPSISEGMPIALLEAMGYGCAIVASSVGAIPDVVRDRVDALLVPPGDPAALCSAIVEVATDDVLRRSLGEAARDRVQEYAPERIYERYASIYEQTLEHPRQTP